MARKSGPHQALDVVAAHRDNSETDATSKKKRKRKEGKPPDTAGREQASENADARTTENKERRKRKKTNINTAGDDAQVSEDRNIAVESSPDVHIQAGHEKTKKKKKKKRRQEEHKEKERAPPSPITAPIDPVLTQMDRGGDANTNAFLSAVVTAAAGHGVQDQSHATGFQHQSSTFEASLYQNHPHGLDGPMVSFSGEELARALQGVDVAKLADALQALGDAGSSAFPLPGQPGPSQTGPGSFQLLPPPQHAYGHGTMNPGLPVHVNPVPGPHNQMPVPSATILGHSTRNSANESIVPRQSAAPVSHISSEDHAHLLASKWLSASKLNDLSKTIGLQYKKGKFSASEEAILKNAVESYRIRNGLTNEQLSEVIFAKGSKGKDNAFWFEITAHVALRPVVAVYHHIRRSFHPLKQQGKWAPAEDDALRQAVADLGQSWEKVSERVGRMASDCRDRWRNHIYNREGRVFGPWTKEEEERLTQIVTELTTAQGKSSDTDVFWTQVAERMGGTRGRQQCRIKWTDALSKTVKNDGQRPRWSQQDAYILVHKVSSLNVNDDSEIDWKLLIDDDWNLWSAHTLQRRWLTLKRSVRGYEEMSHQEIMDILRVKKSHPPPTPAPVRRRVTSAPIVPAEAQASDVAIETGFPVPGSSGFEGMHPPAFAGNPLDAGQQDPHFGHLAQGVQQAGISQVVAPDQPDTESNGAKDPDDDSSSSSSSSSSSDSDSDTSDSD